MVPTVAPNTDRLMFKRSQPQVSFEEKPLPTSCPSFRTTLCMMLLAAQPRPRIDVSSCFLLLNESKNGKWTVLRTEGYMQASRSHLARFREATVKCMQA